MKRCKDCKWWEKTSDIVDDPNPSGKCSGRGNEKYDGYGTHAYEESCYDFMPINKKSWKFWRPKQ